MAWELDGKQSIYMQLVDRIRQRIITGYYPPGSRMASVRELADEAGVNPNTMQRALAALEESGIIYAQRTAGRFVTDDKEKLEALRMETAGRAVQEFMASMSELGFGREEVISLLNRKEEQA